MLTLATYLKSDEDFPGGKQVLCSRSLAKVHVGIDDVNSSIRTPHESPAHDISSTRYIHTYFPQTGELFIDRVYVIPI